MVEVRKLSTADREALDTVSRWMYTWWGKHEGKTEQAVRAYMEHCTEDGRLPQTFAAFDRGEVVGAYQFTLSDMFVRPDIYPWLANVYVPPEHRGKGYSRVMLESVRENAAKLPGVDEIFLFTPHTGLYEKYGWEYMEDAELYNGDKPNRMYRLRLK